MTCTAGRQRWGLDFLHVLPCCLILQVLGSDGSLKGSSLANLSAYLQLLARQEDPDTLFFNRELEITGDTELGLLVKNMLDAVEWPSLPSLPRLPIAGR